MVEISTELSGLHSLRVAEALSVNITRIISFIPFTWAGLRASIPLTLGSRICDVPQGL